LAYNSLGDTMPIIGPFLVSSIAGLSTVLGSFVIFFHWKKDNINKFITFCLSLSFSVMIGLSITELIPESTFIIITNYKIAKGIFLCFLIFFLGVGLIHYLNDKIVSKNSSQNLYKLGILSMLALMLHNLPEGIATFMSAYQDMDLGIKLAIAITLHNIPEGISIAVPIYYATGSKKEAILKTFLSGLAEPLGALLAYLFFARFITATFISFILLLVAGIMITLSIQKLFPEALEYHENKYIWIGIIVGVILILVNHFVL
jgi:ZIP family zinc transporter